MKPQDFQTLKNQSSSWKGLSINQIKNSQTQQYIRNLKLALKINPTNFSSQKIKFPKISPKKSPEISLQAWFGVAFICNVCRFNKQGKICI